MPVSHIIKYLFMLPALVALLSCGNEPSPVRTAASKPLNCSNCHPYALDASHDLGCTTCHGGTEPASGKEVAHADLIRTPAHPDRMVATCGRCHGELTSHAAKSPHFTLANEVNSVRQAFGARETLASLTEVPVHTAISSPLDLADDLLRRRCLACHVYSKGDPYPETTRGTGCAACHLDYRGGKLIAHQFRKHPADQNCLHCHYGNFVGADYHGRFEHDYSYEFRTPFRTDAHAARPYGVEYHQLAADIHARAGMACVDCHSVQEIMGVPHGKDGDHPKKITCESCHAPGALLPIGLALTRDGKRLVLTTKHLGRKLTVPPLSHPAHAAYGDKAACGVCHAQWSFNDQDTHLIRLDSKNYDPWSMVTVQGSFEVENQLETELYGGAERFAAPTMHDKITGTPALGIWLKGYRLRRWEAPLIGRDARGRLTLLRPLLDLSLSYVNQAGEVVHDAVRANAPANGLRPYTPHTIGKAGAFYRQRLNANITTGTP